MPALITEEQHALAQELLERNSRLSPRNTRKPSLLQGILVCRECGHSYYRSSTRSKTGNVHHYYRCSGADSFRRPEGRVCAARPVRIDEVDEPVWAQVLALLENPELIKTEIDRRLQALRAEHPATRRRDGLQRDLTRAQNALRRLIDGYQEQLITLEELRARMPELRRREATLRAELDALDTDLHDAETYLKLTETLDAFRARLSANAEDLTVEQRQEIVRLVVREVLLGDDDITVRHSIPVPTAASQAVRYCIHSVKALRKAIRQVFGDDVPVQRCVRHKERNVLEHLPERDRRPIKRRLARAWTGDRPRQRARAAHRLADELERDHPGAAASLREGMDETLTVTRLGITGKLKLTLQSTNPCESMISTVRVIQRNVKNWSSGEMCLRWTAAGMLEAETRFRKVEGYRGLAQLAVAIEADLLRRRNNRHTRLDHRSQCVTITHRETVATKVPRRLGQPRACRRRGGLPPRCRLSSARRR